ncbi:MAG: ABC transporter ATP-binding protein [Thermodesulfobacteriota bacterium]
MNNAYNLDDVAFSYGTSQVLFLERIEIRPGEMVAVVGPNGSGKTTLLHLLAFVEPPSSGSIRFFGEECSAAKRLGFRRRVGLLTQNPYLFRGTVMDNVQWGLKIRGVTAARRHELALEALRSVGLAGFEARRARELSGGESQRTALARILVLEPEVLLLDEPGNHLDRESVQLTERIVANLNRKKGTTVIFVSHRASDVDSLAQRVLHLHQGRLDGNHAPARLVPLAR